MAVFKWMDIGLAQPLRLQMQAEARGDQGLSMLGLLNASSLQLRTASEGPTVESTWNGNRTEMAKQRESGTQRAPDDTALAWALAASTRPYLSAGESFSVHSQSRLASNSPLSTSW
jgi:hypothetical protein